MDDNKLGPLPEIGPLPQSNGWVLAYTADQMRAYGEACVAAERERCAKMCELEAEGFGGVALGRMATERGKLVHEAMAAGALNCAAAIRNA